MSPALPAETLSITENSLEISDENWLKGLSFHSTAPEELTTAASKGEIVAVAEFLHATGVNGTKISRQNRRKILEQLQILWLAQMNRSSAIDEASLAHCLFETDLESGELSGRVETIMASTPSAPPDLSTLIAAFWLLRLIPQKLEPQTLFSLWRWTLEGGRAHLSSSEPVAADQGCAAFDQIEMESLFGWIYHDLKAERKLARQGIRSLQQAIDASTDIDGTPHAKWLDQILPRLSQLSRLQLFAQTVKTSVLSRKDEKRVQRLFGRVVGLVTPAGMAFRNENVSLAETVRLFRTIADVLDFP
ncbi:MAG TPA: hypothetical protein VNQ76_10455, partial [Planctomicrobium sp.]|nr:hypothetical protein [Planctomicrobium sp.]